MVKITRKSLFYSFLLFYLVVQALTMFHGRQRPFVDVQLEILENSCGLAPLPFYEVQEGLAVASVWMLPVHPRRDLLREDLVDAKGPAGSLTVKPLRTLVVEVRVVHGFRLPAFALAY